MKTIFTALATTALAMPALADTAPNILLIIADDMGVDASRCYALGDQQAPMPNIESLCASGMVFENFYSAPTCSPTRATIISGQYGFRTGVGAAIVKKGSSELSPDVTSIFDVLAATEYSSNLIGKWHLASPGTGFDHPAQLGVSDYFGLFIGALPDYSHWTAISDEKPIQIDEYATTEFTNRAIDWIGVQENPWFLWLAYTAPHTPFHLPPADLHSFDDLPDTEAAIAANPLAYYNAMLEALDTEIGRLLDSMPQAERDNTIIMFIGDNGSPNQVTRGFYGAHGAKSTIYEGGTHVPLVVSGPGVASGRTEGFATT
ncbi:sulfatase-like hydrolase/transferase, partial [Phaeovulum sp.]|uniref:sulfatase-like hydrolase/transferase n=1 Tax=Phaeovulum sp. TaxID=2934796 RepID=UPI00356859BF